MAPKSKPRKNRYKIRCLERNVEMDFDYKKKHNLKFHQDLLAQRKSIRYCVVGAPKNSFEAAVSGKSLKSKTGDVSAVSTEVSLTDIQNDGESDLCSKSPEQESAQESKNLCETVTISDQLPEADYVQLFHKNELPKHTEITLPGDGKNCLSALHTGSSSIKRRFNDSNDEITSKTYLDNSQEKRKKIDHFEEDVMETSLANSAE